MPNLIADPSFALFRQARTMIPLLEHRVDAYPVEEHRLDLATTEHPVESGNELTDNAVKRREHLRLQGWVSDLLPARGNERTLGDGGLGAVVSGIISRRTNSVDRPADTWGEIIQLMENRTPITVVTALRTYRNMLIVRAVAPVDATTGHRSLRFTIDLAEVLFTDTELSRISLDNVVEDGPAALRPSLRDYGDLAARTVPAPEPVREFVRDASDRAGVLRRRIGF